MSFLAPSSVRSLCPLRLCVGIFVLLTTAACFTQQAQSPPPKPALPPLEFLGAWGIRGDGPGQLSGPAGIAVDSVGNVFISDRSSKFIHKFNPDGHPLQSFQDPSIKDPLGIAIDHGDAIYVSDCKLNAIQIFLFSADRFLTIRGAASHRLVCPSQVAVSVDGLIFAIDNDGHRIQKFNARGRWLKSWGKKGSTPGEIGRATAVAVGADNLLYVLDGGNRRVQRFTLGGEFVSQWEIPLAAGADNPNWLTGLVVSRESVLVANARAGTIDVWTLDGQRKFESNVADRLHAEQLHTLHLALSPRGELLVLDVDGARVLRFRINF